MFEAVVGHCRRGGWGDNPKPLFAFEATQLADLDTTASLALMDQGFAERGDITGSSERELSCRQAVRQETADAMLNGNLSQRPR